MPSKATTNLRAVRSDDLLNEQHLADERVANAIAEILTNEETPLGLFNKVADYVCEASSGDITKMWTPPMLVHLLSFVRQRETEGPRRRRA